MFERPEAILRTGPARGLGFARGWRASDLDCHVASQLHGPVVFGDDGAGLISTRGPVRCEGFSIGPMARGVRFLPTDADAPQCDVN